MTLVTSGMNMGFQDAKNLAWKLALAIKCTFPAVVTVVTAERVDISPQNTVDVWNLPNEFIMYVLCMQEICNFFSEGYIYMSNMWCKTSSIKRYLQDFKKGWIQKLHIDMKNAMSLLAKWYGCVTQT